MPPYGFSQPMLTVPRKRGFFALVHKWVIDVMRCYATLRFLPREAMLARYMLWPCVRLFVPLTPLLRFVLDLSYKLYLHCYAAVGKNSTDMSRRAVRLR